MPVRETASSVQRGSLVGAFLVGTGRTRVQHWSTHVVARNPASTALGLADTTTSGVVDAEDWPCRRCTKGPAVPSELDALPDAAPPTRRQARTGVTDLARAAPSGLRTRTSRSRPTLSRWFTAGVVGVASAVLMLLRLTVPTPIGMANNGDGLRLVCQLGVYPRGDTWSELYLDWTIFTYFAATDPIDCNAYPSSTVWLMRLWQALSRFFGTEADLDMRVALPIYALFTGAVIFAICLAFRGWIRQVIAATLVFLVIGDATFVGYIASPFSETAGLIGLIGLSIAAVYLASGATRRRMPLFALVLFVAFSVLLIGAKVQMITLIVPLAIFLIGLAARRIGRKRRLSGVAFILVAMVGTGIFGYTAHESYEQNPFSVINPTEVIFVGVLRGSDTPAEDLEEMGLPAEMAKYQGKSWWAGDEAPQTYADFDEVSEKMTYGAVAAFLLRHPDRAVQMADVSTRDFFAVRPDYMGSYSRDSGHEARERESRLILATEALQQPAGGGLLWFIAGGIAMAAGAILVIRLRPRGSRANGFGWASLLLNAVVIVQFVTCTYGESIENTKHLVVAILAAMLCTVFIVLGLMGNDAAATANDPND